MASCLSKCSSGPHGEILVNRTPPPNYSTQLPPSNFQINAVCSSLHLSFVPPPSLIPTMATHRPEKPDWMAVPQFGGWDQRHGGAPDYSVVFSRARANRREHKSDITRASFGNDQELIVPPYQPHNQVDHKKRKKLMRFLSCCYYPTP